ncbi:hypothetical protein DRN46_06955 [Thermococci archaeon]|nr:MAG: hypothetical protein DRN46_06955 [Thermococci archaeon]
MPRHSTPLALLSLFLLAISLLPPSSISESQMDVEEYISDLEEQMLEVKKELEDKTKYIPDRYYSFLLDNLLEARINLEIARDYLSENKTIEAIYLASKGETLMNAVRNNLKQMETDPVKYSKDFLNKAKEEFSKALKVEEEKSKEGLNTSIILARHMLSTAKTHLLAAELDLLSIEVYPHNAGEISGRLLYNSVVAYYASKRAIDVMGFPGKPVREVVFRDLPEMNDEMSKFLLERGWWRIYYLNLMQGKLFELGLTKGNFTKGVSVLREVTRDESLLTLANALEGDYRAIEEMSAIKGEKRKRNMSVLADSLVLLSIRTGLNFTSVLDGMEYVVLGTRTLSDSDRLNAERISRKLGLKLLLDSEYEGGWAILVGGPVVNELSRELNEMLPIPFSDGKLGECSSCAIASLLYREGNFFLVLAGCNRSGTTAVVNQFLNGKITFDEFGLVGSYSLFEVSGDDDFDGEVDEWEEWYIREVKRE